MKLLPPSPQDNINRSAIFWALLSQSIWLPVFVSGVQEKWSANKSDDNSFLATKIPYQSTNTSVFGSPAIGTRSYSAPSHFGRQETGIVLNSVFVDQRSTLPKTSRILTDANSLNSASASARPATNDASESHGNSKLEPDLTQSIGSGKQKLFSNGFIRHLYSRAELLGGTLTLQDLAEPLMPPIARAERAQWSRTGDPLAPLPELWREPMRRALKSLINTDVASTHPQGSAQAKENLHLESARFVHVPSSKIRRASEVPLALQADGTVDILNQPDDPAVIEEINHWSTKQKLPEKGKISPAVVHLHPMEPLNSDRSTRGKQISDSSSKLSSPEAVLPTAPSPAPKAVAPPAATTLQETSSGRDLTPTPISSAVPELPRNPEPATSREAES